MEKLTDGKGVAIGVEHWRAGRLRALGTGSVESYMRGSGMIGEREGMAV